MSFLGLLLPGTGGTMMMSAFPASLGEVALMLWLLIAGIRPARNFPPSPGG